MILADFFHRLWSASPVIIDRDSLKNNDYDEDDNLEYQEHNTPVSIWHKHKDQNSSDYD